MDTLNTMRERVAVLITLATRLLVRAVAIATSVGASSLALMSRVLTSLGTRSAEIAEIETPVDEERHRGRRRSGLWFAGGFVVGAGAGVAAAEYVHRQHHDHEVDDATARHLAAVAQDTDTAG